MCGYLSISVTVTQFKLCFDVQRSKHSFAADRSDTNLIDDADMNKNNAMPVKMQLTRAIVRTIAVRGTLLIVMIVVRP